MTVRPKQSAVLFQQAGNVIAVTGTAANVNPLLTICSGPAWARNHAARWACARRAACSSRNC
jgi:hypothetical protein